MVTPQERRWVGEGQRSPGEDVSYCQYSSPGIYRFSKFIFNNKIDKRAITDE